MTALMTLLVMNSNSTNGAETPRFDHFAQVLQAVVDAKSTNSCRKYAGEQDHKRLHGEVIRQSRQSADRPRVKVAR